MTDVTTHSAPDTATMRETTGIGAAGEAARDLRATADGMGEIARRAMDQGQAAMSETFGRMASIQMPFAERGCDQSRALLEGAIRMMDAYGAAATRSATQMQAVMLAYGQLGQGMQELGRALLDQSRRTAERIGSANQAMLAVRAPSELASLQRDLCMDLVGGMIEAQTTWLQHAAQSAQKALAPLRDGSRPMP